MKKAYRRITFISFFSESNFEFSSQILMEAGNRYYFEFACRENKYDDFFHIGAELPDGTHVKPITADYLALYQ